MSRKQRSARRSPPRQRAGDTVVFLGAGASKAFGYPMTGEILPKITKQWKANGPLFKDINDPQRDKLDRLTIRKFLVDLLPGLATAKRAAIPLITDVFSLVDHACLRGEAITAELSTDAVRQFSHLLKQAIFDILIETWIKKDGRRQQVLNRKLARWLNSLAQPTVISTNYDTVVEDAILDPDDGHRDAQAATIDWGFDWRSPFKNEIVRRPHQPWLRLYKLHGSLSCVRCPLCGQTYLNVHGIPAIHAFSTQPDDAGTCHCGYWRLELQIIPPSLIRELRDASLAETWKHALQQLRLAKEWFIVGYSLPAEDIAIRELLIRGYRARETSPSVTVIQRDNSARDRYRLLFPDCNYMTGGFKRFLGKLRFPSAISNA